MKTRPILMTILCAVLAAPLWAQDKDALAAKEESAPVAAKEAFAAEADLLAQDLEDLDALPAESKEKAAEVDSPKLKPVPMAPLPAESKEKATEVDSPELEPVPMAPEVVPAVEPKPAVDDAQGVQSDLGAEQQALDQLIELGGRELDGGIEVGSASQSPELITISLDDVPMQDVVRMFTRISGANIVAGTNLQGRVTVSLQDVEWEPALRVILHSVGMVIVEKSPGIYSILSKEELEAEPVTAETIFLKFTTVSNVLPVVEKMLVSTNASVAGFAAANALVVQENLNQLTRIQQMVEKIDKPRKQVFIEAKFVELTDQAIKDMGINWQSLAGYQITLKEPTFSYTRTRSKDKGIDKGRVYGDQRGTVDEYTRRNDYQSTSTLSDNSDSSTGNGYDFSVGSGTPPTFSLTTSSGAAGALANTYDTYQQAASGNNWNNSRITSDTYSHDSVDDVKTTTEEVLSSVLTADDFSVVLSALKQNSGVDVVSNPRIIVASGETASIHVGRNEPNIVALPQGDMGDRYAYSLDSAKPYIEIGVKVKVTPVVNTDKNITVKIEPELSRKLGDKYAGDLNISFPITQTRKISTEFNLESGRTVAIGGLTETSDSEEVSKIPLLGDIPIIGKYLFSHSHREKLQDEVIIFVTVGLANPKDLIEVSGVPSEGRLIHKHLARKALEVDTEQ